MYGGKHSCRRSFLAVLSLIVLVGIVMSADPLQETSKGVQFNYEDSINGHGNFASYNKISAQGPHADARVQNKLANVSLQKMDHGSGSVEKETIMKSNESSMIQIDPDMTYAYALIAVLENNSMVYKPQTMSIGNGYYLTHPVNFNSLLGDKTQIKNYASETSMGQEIKYAHAINMDLMANVEDDYSYTGASKGLARSLMNLNGGVTSGTAHIGMLQGNIGTLDFGKSAWHNPNITIDEVYTGTFVFATKMNLTLPVTKIVSEDSWLPCCSGDWVDMTYSYKKDFGVDVKGIFDCTCPKGLTKA
jgi:hypothetical protein